MEEQEASVPCFRVDTDDHQKDPGFSSMEEGPSVGGCLIDEACPVTVDLDREEDICPSCQSPTANGSNIKRRLGFMAWAPSMPSAMGLA